MSHTYCIVHQLQLGHPLVQFLQLVENLGRHILVDLLVEILPNRYDLFAPEIRGEAEDLLQVDLLLESGQVERPLLGNEPDGRLLSGVLSVTAAENPVKDSSIFSEAWPQEVVVGVLAEPVDVVDLGQLEVGFLLEAEPVFEVVAEVVAEERPHGEGVVHDDLPDVLGRSRRFRSHGRPHEHAVLPVERFVHQRHAWGEREREMFYLTTHSTHFIYGYMTSDIWLRTADIEKGNPLPPHRLLLSINSKGSFICTIPQTG